MKVGLTSLNDQVTVKIGGLPIEIRSCSREFIAMLEARYAGVIRISQAGSPSHKASSVMRSLDRSVIRLEVDIVPPPPIADDNDLEVRHESGFWVMRRGDFRADFDLSKGCGVVRQWANPYSIDAVIRIIHSLVLASAGDGFLLHSTSAILNGNAFLFSGVSGAGKTTIARLAPSGTTLLTDEISYIRCLDSGYCAFGTPFAGEMGTPGANVAAPIAALYFLAKGPVHQIGPINPSPAAQRLLRNMLFFAHDATLVETLFGLACDFVERVQVQELTFKPEPSVWGLIA